MSTMQPKGYPITIAGEEHQLLFTLAVVDEIQDHYDEAMIDVLSRLRDEREVIRTTGYIMTVLLQDEEIRAGREPLITEEQVRRMISMDMLENCVKAILEAYGISVPEADDEDDDPNLESLSN